MVIVGLAACGGDTESSVTDDTAAVVATTTTLAVVETSLSVAETTVPPLATTVPVTAPATAAPVPETTVAPTTMVPTTAAPTTAAPTTVPVTVAPTTAAPTTLAPPPATTAPCRVVVFNETAQRGDCGEGVVFIQERLTVLGFPAAADGLFGPGTETAVKNFQTSRGLDPDGIVGPLTWAALVEGGIGD